MELAELYDRFARQLYAHALTLTGQAADAEDVLQTVFARVAGRARSRRCVNDPEAYLHAAVRRESLRSIRRRRRFAEPPPDDLLVPFNGARPEDAEAVSRALARLPGEQREVVVLHVWEGMTFRRVGEILGVPTDTAASRYRYARAKLKELLREPR